MTEWAAPRTVKYQGFHALRSWRLRLYEVHLSPPEMNDAHGVGGLKEVVGWCLDRVPQDPEYELFRVGIACAHFGRRGLTLTLAHYGLWGDMFEVFICGWHRPHSAENFEELTSADPLVCFHDVPVLFSDVAVARSSVAAAASSGMIRWSEVFERYLSSPGVSFG